MKRLVALLLYALAIAIIILTPLWALEEAFGARHVVSTPTTEVGR